MGGIPIRSPRTRQPHLKLSATTGSSLTRSSTPGASEAGTRFSAIHHPTPSQIPTNSKGLQGRYNQHYSMVRTICSSVRDSLLLQLDYCDRMFARYLEIYLVCTSPRP